MILGREVLGYPKKIGDISIDYGDEVRPDAALTLHAARKGHDIVSMSGKIGRRAASPPPMLATRMNNTIGTFGASLPRLISFTVKEEILAAYHAELSLEIHASPRDPLHELSLRRPHDAYVYRINVGAARVPLPLPIGFVSPRRLLQSLHVRSL